MGRSTGLRDGDIFDCEIEVGAFVGYDASFACFRDIWTISCHGVLLGAD